MILLVILSLLLIIGLSVYSGSTAIFISLFLFYIGGSIISILLSNKRTNQRSDLTTIFNVAFFIYLLFALIAFLAFNEINGFFIYSDQVEFYDIGNELGNTSSLKEIFNLCFIDRIHHINEGALFLFGTLAFFANIFDGNSVLFQIINVTYFSILINLFVYKILLFYVERKLALKYSLFYLLFSYVLSFSPWLLRDIQITFFFAIAFYIFHLSFTIKRFLYLLILQIVVTEFRFASGMAFAFFPLAFIYLRASKTTYKYYLYVVASSTIIIAMAYSYKIIIDIFSGISESLDHYSSYSINVAEEQGGLGLKLLKLPFGIKQFAIVMYSQISPFPPWHYISKANTFIQGTVGVVLLIAPVFWGYVTYVVVTSIKKNYKFLSNFTIWLLFFSLCFLFLNSSNMNLRRFIAVYPIVYALFVFIQSKTPILIINKKRKQYILLYTGLVVVYIFLKYT